MPVGPVELVLLLDGQPRHPPALGGQRVAGAGQLLLLHEQLLARGLPLLGDTIGGVFMADSSRVVRRFDDQRARRADAEYALAPTMTGSEELLDRHAADVGDHGATSGPGSPPVAAIASRSR